MSTPADTTTAPIKKRNPVERIVVRAILLLLVAILGIEYWVQQSFQKGWAGLQDAISANDNPKGGRLTSEDVSRILGGKQPEFKGSPGQILMNSPYYEAYVWRSLLKRRFTAPPETPEEVDQIAIFSGEVRPDLIKYRTPEKKDTQDFFSAYVIYVYYTREDPKTHVREVLNVVQEREKYLDELNPIPTPEQLKKKHEAALERAKLNRYKTPPTPEQLELMDTWKHPPVRSTENSTNASKAANQKARETDSPELPSPKSTSSSARSP